jgi:dipeptidyl aminopeptidase/acylaminoacyl peptidase
MKILKATLRSRWALSLASLLLVSPVALAVTPGAHLGKAAFLRAYAPILRGAHALAKDPAAYRASLAQDPLALPRDSESGIWIFGDALSELRRTLEADLELREQTRAEMDAIVRELTPKPRAKDERDAQREKREETRVRHLVWRPAAETENFNSVFYANEQISLATTYDFDARTTWIHVRTPGQTSTSFAVKAKSATWKGIVSPDGKKVYLGSNEGELIERDLSDPENLELGHVAELRGGGTFDEFVFSPDGKYLAFENSLAPAHIMVWDTQERELVYSEASPLNWGRSLRFSPDGQRLLLTGAGDESTVFDLRDKCKRFFAAGSFIGTPRGGIRGAGAFSPDGASILSFSIPRTQPAVEIRDSRTLALMRTIPFSGSFSRAAFSPDGRYLVAFAERGLDSFRLLNLESGRVTNGSFDLPFVPSEIQFRDQDSIMYVHSAGMHLNGKNLPGKVHVFRLADLIAAYVDEVDTRP